MKGRLNFLFKFFVLIGLLSIYSVSSTSIDISSFGNIDQIKQTSIAFDLNINFDKKM
jgi:hypothetical protein